MSDMEKSGFRAVKDEIARRIRSGLWGPGAALPGEIDLAAEFGVARATANRALRELADEGLLERKRKAGTRVRPSPLRQARLAIPLVRAEIEAMGAAYRYRLVRRDVAPPPEAVRVRLALEAGAAALRLECLHFADGRPFQHEERWINLEALPKAASADFSQTGPNEWLVREAPFSRLEMSFSAVALAPGPAAHLEMSPGEPAFLAERATWWEGRPLTWVRLCFGRGYRMTMRC